MRLLVVLLIALAARARSSPLVDTIKNEAITMRANQTLTDGLTRTLDILEQIGAFDLLTLNAQACMDKGNTQFVEFIKDAHISLERAMARVRLANTTARILLRRTVLACVVARYVQQNPDDVDSESERLFTDIITKLYSQHVLLVVRKGLVEHLHISKSGGTSFSAAARLSGCTMPEGIGQLEQLGDVPRWVNGTAFAEVTQGFGITLCPYGKVMRPSVAASCTRRLAFLAAPAGSQHSYQYNYLSNEYTLHGGGRNASLVHLCDQVVNVVMLRDPMERLVSHLHHLLARFKYRLHNHPEEEAGFSFHTLFCAWDAAGVFDRVAPPVVDNYLTRSFLGERGFNAPVGEIGPEQLQMALQQLLQFDLVLDLEAGEEAINLVLRQGLGWNVAIPPHSRSGEDVYPNLDYNPEECPLEFLLQAVGPRHEPDRQLYSVGRTLAFLDRLLLSLAQALGLQPVQVLLGDQQSPPPVSQPAANTTAGTPGEALKCGLLDPSLRRLYNETLRAGRSHAKHHRPSSGTQNHR